MSEYDVDFGNYIGGLLPQALRGTVRAWAEVLCRPFRWLHHRFMEYRTEKLWALQFNAQTVRLEALLNDYFRDTLAVHAPGRRFEVGDGNATPSLFVYPNAECLPVMVGFVTVTSASLWGAVPFEVRIPVELQGDQSVLDRTERLVQRYKLIGTKHVIVYF